MKLPNGARIYVATIAVDMRCGFDGLAALARAYVDREVKDSDALFVFFNRRVDRVKLVWWERTGYCLFYKRLERGRFAFDQAVPELATQLAQMAREHTDVRGHKRAAAKPHGRSPIPDDLPVERIELPPPLDTTGMVKIGEEIKELVEWRAASMVRVQIVRPKFAWPGDERRGVAIAELPDSPIPRCKAGVGLLAHVIVSKYADHLLLHRQAHMLERQGVEFSRSTLCGWLKPCAKLLGNITHAMAVDAFSSPWIGIDATGVLVKDAERYRRCHFWVIVAGRTIVEASSMRSAATRSRRSWRSGSSRSCIESMRSSAGSRCRRSSSSAGRERGLSSMPSSRGRRSRSVAPCPRAHWGRRCSMR